MLLILIFLINGDEAGTMRSNILHKRLIAKMDTIKFRAHSFSCNTPIPQMTKATWNKRIKGFDLYVWIIWLGNDVRDIDLIRKIITPRK